MKLVCMTQVYNANTHRGHDGKTNIERFMQSVIKYCDGLVIFDDGSTDGTREVITDHSGSIEIQILSNKVNTPENESYHRARCLEHCRRLEADWVLALDVDEVLERDGEKTLRQFVEYYDEVGVEGPVAFFYKDLWRTDRYIRVDGDWCNKVYPRLFRLTDDLFYKVVVGVRTGLMPDNIYGNCIQSPLRIIHLGFVDDKMIIDKYRRFQSLDVDLKELLGDSNLRLSEASSSWFDEDWPRGPGIEVYEHHIEDLIS